MLTKRPRGTGDILPGQVEKWRYIEKIMRSLGQDYNYEEIRTPVFEHTELFERGVGEDTDIVEKEMYTFLDRGERSVTLRPEGTAPVVRAYLENKLYAQPQPVKLFYMGPMFRYDRPQAGRFRQFHQVGVEVFGSHHPAVDAEVVAMAMGFCDRVGLTNLELHINSVGCPQCRPGLRKILQDFFEPRRPELCTNCQERWARNPLRIIDCKNGSCRDIAAGAPSIADCLCSDCQAHFAGVRRYLDILQVPYIINHKLVRGLDYYTHTAFEIMAPDIGAQSSIGGGGRYNGLIEVCGGPSIPGVGYALGLERVLLAMEKQGVDVESAGGPDVFVVILDPADKEKAVEILSALRSEGISSDQDYQDRSLKAQMKYASKLNSKYTLLVGGRELERGSALLREMQTGEQEEVPWQKIVERIKQSLGR